MSSQRAPGTTHHVDIPPEAVTDPVRTIDPESFTPRLLALLSNAIVWRESTLLRQHLGFGTNDWRVMSALGLRPGSSATEVSDFLGLNKAVISKSVTVLVAQGQVVLSEGPRGSRPMYLTQAGAETHSMMYPIAMSGQDIILEGLTDEEVTALNAVLQKMLARIRQVPLPTNGSAEAGATTETEPEA